MRSQAGTISRPMDGKPKRRWFQGRLSTWLALVTLLGWMMSQWPWMYLKWVRVGDSWPDCFERHYAVAPRVVAPAFFLIAFIAWKATWRVVELRRERSVTQA